MKAEHRKELQTNLLADRMGRLLQNVKGRPSRRGMLLVLLILVLVVGGLIAYLVYQGNINRNAKFWVEFDEIVDHKTLVETANQYKDTQQGKAARAEIAWLVFWEFGIKSMGTDTAGGLKRVKEAREQFETLAEDCKDDPVLAAEALYGVAVAEETLAADPKDRQLTQLDKALKAYQLVNEKYEKSGFAAKARERAKQLESKEDRARIARFYEELQSGARQLENLHQHLGPMTRPKK